MVKKIYSLLIFLSLAGLGYAGLVYNPMIHSNMDMIQTIEEEDGAPTVPVATIIKVPNSTLTDNADGTVSLDFGVLTEADPVASAVNGILKSDGTTLSAAVADTDYDSSITNEINIITTPDTEATEGLGITFADTGIMTITELGDTITFDATEADTLASVTGRGATTATASTFSGGITATLTGQASTVATITGLAPDTQNTYARTQYLIPYASTTTAFSEIAIGDATQVLTSNGAGAAPTFQAASGGGGGLAWEVISGADTAASGEGFLIDSSAGVVTLTLPATPSAGDVVGVCDYTDSATTNAITIARNAVNIEGVAGDLVVDVDGAGFTLVYSDATRGWEIVTEIGGSIGASTTLNNLSATAINTSLISDTDNTDDLGSDAKKWKDGYLAGSMKVLGDIYTVAYTDYFASSTITGWSDETGSINYKKIGNTVYVHAVIAGTSNATTISFTLPYANKTGVSLYFALGNTTDNGAQIAVGNAALADNASQVVCKTSANGAWTASAYKQINISFFYETE